MRTADLHIYCCHAAGVDPALIEAGVTLLDAAEQRRLENFHAPVVRREYILSRMLLRSALAEHLQTASATLQFIRDADGKPQLAPPFAHWHFNLSHGGEWVALALSSAGPVGVDIEIHARKNNVRAIARRFFSDAENAVLDAIDDDSQWLRRFFGIWTLKEAHAKALGCGLSKILSCSSFVLRDDVPGNKDFAAGAEPGAIELQLTGIAAGALPVVTHLYRPATDTSLAVSQQVSQPSARPVDVALHRWSPGVDGAAHSAYFELAPTAIGNWRPAGASTDSNPRA